MCHLHKAIRSTAEHSALGGIEATNWGGAPVHSDSRGEHGGSLLQNLPSVARHQLTHFPCLAERNGAQPVLDALCQQQTDLQDGRPPLVIYSHSCCTIPASASLHLTVELSHETTAVACSANGVSCNARHFKYSTSHPQQ
jgi:hypothetical protein